ncbi:sulfatase-like hydrolase/transferase [Maribacter polysaccharolyticus]|uniref:sulfatase-like hydrolase/transferase n=1 Tax=Maribacter polysaccharolyticus TaxID=3020831 RepID=UPI00237F2467|nr:sulfatase-like hydrolase/transferase [Maribacter polysaccharolyticus]MDE3742674.1 sulfatase-like hydrolase/transferase [Maribacter polysaccharolyticus]
MGIFKLITVCLIVVTSFYGCKEETKTEKESVNTISKKQPNIIFIFADDWGYGDLGIHGSTFCKTPNLDKMASEGIDFQNFSVVNPVCSPSRVGVVTGQFPARQSVHGHFASVASHAKRNMPDWLDPKAPMLPRMLKKAGYATAHFGKWHLTNTHVEDAPSPLEYGYDEYGAFNLAGRLHQMQADSTLYKTIDFVKRHKDKPFFINAWVHATHTPHYPKEEYMQQFAHLDEQQQVYAAVVSEYDARIGDLFATLKELGLDDNTLVVFSSDNGPEISGSHKKIDDNSTGPGLGEYYSVGEANELSGRKRSLFAGGVRIPFIVRWPGNVPEGKVDKTTEMAAVDLLPTFLELAGATYPEGYVPDGESIVAAIKGEAYKREKPIYWDWRFSNDRPYFWPSAAIQENNWKLLTNKKMNRTELYDISTDWGEQKDVSADNPGKVKALGEKLEMFQKTLPEAPPANTFSKERKTLELE